MTVRRTMQSERAYFSRSIMQKDMQGMTFEAISSISKHSIVAINAIRPATLAWTKLSFRLRVKAGTKTFLLVLYPSEGAIRPSRMHVLVRMDASVSIWLFARCLRRSLFKTRSESFGPDEITFNMKYPPGGHVEKPTLGAISRTDRTVASRITATVSPKPVCWGKRVSLK